MPPRHDAEESFSLRVRQVAFDRLVAEKVHPPGEECRLRILKLWRQFHRVEGSAPDRAGTGQRGVAEVVGPLPSPAVVGLPPAIEAVLRTVFALLDDAHHGGAHYWIGELPAALQERLESFVDRAVFVGLVEDFVDDPLGVVRLQQQLLADLQRDARSLALEVLALAATLRTRGKPELAALMEAAARRLARSANSAAVEMDGLAATGLPCPDLLPPPHMLSGRSIWTHGPPSDAQASSRERVASGERRALRST